MAVKSKRKFVLKIDPHIHMRLKVEAARLMIPLTEYATEILRLGLSASTQRSKDGK